jgi:hypothetical protein
MKTFQITNTTKNKVVLTKQFNDAAEAFGKYVSCLMLAGIVPMRDDSYKATGDDTWVLSNGWNFKVEEVA